MHTVINANILSCIIHQLNIKKCITKQYHEMTIEYLSLFVSWVDSFLSLPLHHLLHSWLHHFLSKCSRWIRGSSRIESFIFPHRLRDLLWMVRAWSSIAPIFFSLIISWASSCVGSSTELLKVSHFLLAHILQKNESHDLGRPFKVVITTSTFSTSSFTASSCSLIWETP